MPTNEEIARVKASFKPMRALQIRQVVNGYLVTTNTTYVDPATNVASMSENMEGVAANATDALYMATNYIHYNTFEHPMYTERNQGQMDLTPRMPPVPQALTDGDDE